MSKWTAGEEEMGGETQVREMSRLYVWRGERGRVFFILFVRLRQRHLGEFHPQEILM